jgi:hypothetical protein
VGRAYHGETEGGNVTKTEPTIEKMVVVLDGLWERWGTDPYVEPVVQAIRAILTDYPKLQEELIRIRREIRSIQTQKTQEFEGGPE